MWSRRLTESQQLTLQINNSSIKQATTPDNKMQLARIALLVSLSAIFGGSRLAGWADASAIANAHANAHALASPDPAALAADGPSLLPIDAPLMKRAPVAAPAAAAEPKAEPKAEPEAEPKAEPEAEAEPDPEAVPEAQPAAEPAAVAVAEPEPAPKPQPQPAPELERRATVHCHNSAKIKRVKSSYRGACDPSRSKGFRSSHNCPGRSYLCVRNGVATCHKSLRGLNMENGECFL
jgi:hypothetical protein